MTRRFVVLVVAMAPVVWLGCLGCGAPPGQPATAQATAEFRFSLTSDGVGSRMVLGSQTYDLLGQSPLGGSMVCYNTLATFEKCDAAGNANPQGTYGRYTGTFYLGNYVTLSGQQVAIRNVEVLHEYPAGPLARWTLMGSWLGPPDTGTPVGNPIQIAGPISYGGDSPDFSYRWRSTRAWGGGLPDLSFVLKVVFEVQG